MLISKFSVDSPQNFMNETPVRLKLHKKIFASSLNINVRDTGSLSSLMSNSQKLNCINGNHSKAVKQSF